MTNQDKKEMLDMIADAIRNTNVISHSENSLIDSMARAIRFKASSLPQDKPERKMPEVDDQYIEVRLMYGVLSVHDGITWSGQDRQRYAFENGFAFRMDERELAEKKCAELNKILAS